jgi:hypothetical protein
MNRAKPPPAGVRLVAGGGQGTGIPRTPPRTIATWPSRGRNTLLDEPRPVQVHHDGTWYPGALTATRNEPDTGWWGFARFIVGVGDDALELEAPGRAARSRLAR